MNRFFNTAGHCKPEIHYKVDPLPRLPIVKHLIEGQHYFVIHAPRQTGKTTYLYALMNRLNSEGKYSALTVNVQAAASARDSEHAMMIVATAIFRQARLRLPESEWPLPVEKPHPDVFPFGQIGDYLAAWAEKNPKPIVLFIDEADFLTEDMLQTIIRQLRAGFEVRPEGFPHSVALVGLRDVRDYKVRTCSEWEQPDIGSLFNIKTKSLFMEGFLLSDMEALLDQHTAETGQEFDPAVRNEIFRLTQGQPWLVNALANQIVAEILENDFRQKITLAHVTQAKEELILRRDPHLDSLINKLREPAVKTVAEAIICGNALLPDSFGNDLAYLRDLGMITGKAPVKFANPVYSESIPRALNYAWQVSFNPDIADQTRYIRGGHLNMDALLSVFQKSCSRNMDIWLENFDFREAGRLLMLMAFIQRIVDSDGMIEREMAMGSGRCDMTVTFRSDRFLLELKLQRDRYGEEDGLKQIAAYIDRMGSDHGYLILFETNSEIPWEKRIYRKEVSQEGKRITLLGM